MEGMIPFDSKDLNVRNGFIRKVYTLLAIMFSIVAIFNLAVAFIPNYEVILNDYVWLLGIAMALYFIIMYALGCFRCVARSFPINVILLMIFALLTGFIISFVIMAYEPSVVVFATVLTAIITIALSIYACCTSTDFTFCV